MTTMSETQTGFDHINLNEVDPSAQSVPDATYNFQVAGVEKKTYTNEKGSGEYISVRFAITDTENYNGRSFFQTLFPGKGTAKQLRLLMDSTGVPQEAGTPIDEWLKEVQTSGARFSCALKTADELDKRDGSMKPRQRLNLWNIAPAN